MFFTLKHFVQLGALFLLSAAAVVYAEQSPRDINDLTLQELLKIKVVTASKREQSLQESPALVEIITQQDLQNRGYRDLSYLLNDLAGVQVSRSFGDNTFNVLWRGIRHAIGSSHLILVDGVRFNHLYNNEAEVLTAMPISNIKHIEVVNGPASVAYGSDAVVGIINIITHQVEAKNTGFVQLGDQDKQVLDASWYTALDDYTLSITARIDNGDVDFSNASTYRWTDPALLTNRDIWGEFADRFGSLTSPHKNRALDARLVKNDHEFAAQYFLMGGGYGLEYTFDHSLPGAGTWYESDASIHWKGTFELSPNLEAKTFLRYRQSNIEDDSFFIEGFLSSDPNSGDIIRLVDASYWESENSSVSGRFEADWRINDRWNLLSGVEFENKDLQKAYNINFGPSLPPSQIDLQSYPFPQPPTADTVDNNHINTRQRSVYALAEYHMPAPEKTMSHHFHFGLRYDQHSRFDGERSIRTGYVNQWSPLTIKLFYGEAFQEPPPRLLYGGWQGSGSDPELNPRTAKTWELNLSYQLANTLMSASVYKMQSRGLFNTTGIGAVNAGKAMSEGGDLRFQYRGQRQSQYNYSLWVAFSWISAREQSFDHLNQLDWLDTGDLADKTLHFGSDFTFNDNWRFHLRGRYYGDRNTVETNPLEKIDQFTNIDFNLIYSPDQLQDFRFGLGVINITDELYFHPGVRSAGASETNPGQVNSNGVWVGSENFYNAKIPQPGRQAQLTIYWDF